MTVLEPLILPADVEIVPIDELPPGLRKQIDYTAGDFSITRPRTRTTSSIVDAKTASLLERFRTPATIVDAVIAYSVATGVDPRATLDDAFGVLGSFVNEGLLVPADSELARPILTTFAPGARIGGFEILAPVHVILDSEVYLARTPTGEAVALKLARDGSEERVRGAFAHEAAILDHLEGRVTPALHGTGEIEGRPFVAMSWCAGLDVYQAASDARRLGGREGRTALLKLGELVVQAYAQLHSQDVLHGDVHPRNVLADGDGKVTIIDFGLAVRRSPSSTPVANARGGIDFFMEPELARARLAGVSAPPVSAAGEQYSLAALLYLLFTGGHTHTFALEREEMLRQLLDEPPLPFEHHGVKDLEAVAGVLDLALAKHPEERYPSVADMSRALRDAVAKQRHLCSCVLQRHESGPARALLEEVLARLAVLDGDLFADGLDAPTASVQNGAAGFAYALLRIAGIHADEVLLGEADVWSTFALNECGKPDSFRNEELQIVPETFGERSFHHGLPGVLAVTSLLAGARGEESSQRLALEAFLTETQKSCEQCDVVFGRAGLLLGCALLLENLLPPVSDVSLKTLGATLSDGLLREIEAQPEIAVCEESRSLGAAHGWAGLLFALLRWRELTGCEVEPAVEERLSQLAALGQPAGRGMLWPHSTGEEALANPIAAGWCNGTAGYVPLWVLAHRLTGEDAHLRLARAAAWTSYDNPAEASDLCCGLVGRAYAMLSFYRHGGGDAWLARAQDLADRAALGIRRVTQRRDSLYKGEVGLALLAADLEDPLHSCMPLFEGEGRALPFGDPGEDAARPLPSRIAFERRGLDGF
jgi:hypothetical protein